MLNLEYFYYNLNSYLHHWQRLYMVNFEGIFLKTCLINIAHFFKLNFHLTTWTLIDQLILMAYQTV